MTNWIKLNYPKILIALVLILSFLYLLYPYSDYDWGWHLKYGEYFFKYGKILKDNPFTWTLPNYQWANHSWIYDIILYFLYSKFGFFGLSIIGALFLLGIIIIATYRFKLSYWQLAILSFFFISIGNISLNESLRAQYFGLLFLTLLISILLKAREEKKYLFFIPPLFLVWANLHGTFTLGFIILAVFLISNIFTKNKDNFFALLLASITSFFLTLLNPYNYKIYIFSLKHLVSPMLSKIFEWVSPLNNCPICNVPIFILFLILISIFFIKRKKITDLPFIIILSFLAYQSFLHRRYLSMFITTALPISALIIKEEKIKLEKNEVIPIVFYILFIFFLFYAVFVRLPKLKLDSYSYDQYCSFSTNCSVDLANYLLDNPPKGKGLNFYDWGGFLIGYGIKTKLFIDGRMHLWSDQGYMPFSDYYNIYYNLDNKLFKSYDFDWLILRNDSPLLQEINYRLSDWGFWKTIYSDYSSTYLIKIR